jgi:hypothetical protein
MIFTQIQEFRTLSRGSEATKIDLLGIKWVIPIQDEAATENHLFPLFDDQNRVIGTFLSSSDQTDVIEFPNE